MKDSIKKAETKVYGPLSDAEKARIEQLHAEGMGRNAIADVLGRNWITVTRYAKKAGLSFSRHDAAVGVEKLRLEAATRRAVLVMDMLDDAERLRENMFAPQKYPPRFNGDTERTFPEPLPNDKAQLAKAVANLVESSLKVENYDRANTTADTARSLLARVAEAVSDQARPYVPPMSDDVMEDDIPESADAPAEDDKGKA